MFKCIDIKEYTIKWIVWNTVGKVMLWSNFYNKALEQKLKLGFIWKLGKLMWSIFLCLGFSYIILKLNIQYLHTYIHLYHTCMHVCVLCKLVYMLASLVDFFLILVDVMRPFAWMKFQEQQWLSFYKYKENIYLQLTCNIQKSDSSFKEAAILIILFLFHKSY